MTGRAGLELQHERHVWMWANYWACRAVAGGVPALPPSPDTYVQPVPGGAFACAWMPNRWAIVPDYERCAVRNLTGDPADYYPVTVCGSDR